MESMKLNSETPFTSCMLEFFNTVIGNNATMSEAFWDNEMKILLRDKYITGLTAQEAEMGTNFLFKSLKLEKLFQRLQQLLCVKFRDAFLQQLSGPSPVMISLDIEKIEMKVSICFSSVTHSVEGETHECCG
jgi:hypothetical protein